MYKAAFFVVAISWAGQLLVPSAWAQRRGGRPASRPPETSSDPAFHPDKLTKMAVIVVGESRGGGGGLGRLGGVPRDTQSDQQRLVEDEFVQSLLQKGYSITARSDVEAVMKEQGFQRSGLTEGNAAAIGKILNVPAVLVVRITESSTQSRMNPRIRGQVLEARASMGARLVGVESAEIWWIGKHNMARIVESRGEASDVLAAVAKAIAMAFPDKKPQPAKGTSPSASRSKGNTGS
jgi:hypothetical protein